MNDRLAYTIPDAVAWSGIGRTSLYLLLAQGKLEARKAGNRTLILAESLRRYVESLPAADIRCGRKAAA